MKQLLKYIFILFICACSSNNENKKVYQEIDLLSQLDIPLSKPVSGDWLYEHKEKGQTFEQFEATFKPTFDSIKNTIIVQPLGNFTKEQLLNIDTLVEYLGIFYQSNVILAPAISDTVIPHYKRRFQGPTEQKLDAGFILNNEMGNKKYPNTAFTLFITSNDIYPEGGNFLFGLASSHLKRGVVSMYRFVDSEDTANYNLALEYLCKVSTHEGSHILGIKHCTKAHCLINGANDLFEMNQSPCNLCSVCLKKLQLSTHFNLKKYTNEMLSFSKKHYFKRSITYWEKANKLIH